MTEPYTTLDNKTVTFEVKQSIRFETIFFKEDYGLAYICIIHEIWVSVSRSLLFFFSPHLVLINSCSLQ